MQSKVLIKWISSYFL